MQQFKTTVFYLYNRRINCDTESTQILHVLRSHMLHAAYAPATSVSACYHKSCGINNSFESV